LDNRVSDFYLSELVLLCNCGAILERAWLPGKITTGWSSIQWFVFGSASHDNQQKTDGLRSERISIRNPPSAIGRD
jgi:hypothetical protein